jgi:hypothetical protein
MNDSSTATPNATPARRGSRDWPVSDAEYPPSIPSSRFRVRSARATSLTVRLQARSDPG